jgi:hypothetical protein
VLGLEATFLSRLRGGGRGGRGGGVVPGAGSAGTGVLDRSPSVGVRYTELDEAAGFVLIVLKLLSSPIPKCQTISQFG